MHIERISKTKAPVAPYAQGELNQYQVTWLGIFIFLIGAIIIPRKL
jgi:hypothetical protein